MSGKSRTIAVAAATTALIGLWVPAALASPAGGPASGSGGQVNGGLVNVNLGSGNTAVGNTCVNNNEAADLGAGLLAWPVNLFRNACVMAGGPSQF